MEIQKAALVAAGALLVLALGCAWLWQPARQLRLQQRHFLQAVERRDGAAVARFVAGEYGDRWGHDKEFLVSLPREALGQFIFLSITGEIAETSVSGGTGKIAVRLRLSGRGGPGAELAIAAVNGLREPFVFWWTRQSGKPWDWRLVRVDQPELEIPDLSFAQ